MFGIVTSCAVGVRKVDAATVDVSMDVTSPSLILLLLKLNEIDDTLVSFKCVASIYVLALLYPGMDVRS